MGFGPPIDSVLQDHEADYEHSPLYAAVYANAVATGRATIALRFDDCPGTDQTIVKPLLDARYLPGGFAVIQGRLDNSINGPPANLTTAQVQQMQADGHEIMCHTRNHTDPSVQANPLAFFVDETVTVAADLRAQNLYINSWVQPGTWTGIWNFDSLAKLSGITGRLLKKTYGAAEAYVAEDTNQLGGQPRPSRFRYGVLHQDGTAPGVDLAALESLVKSSMRYGGRLEILFHTFYFDTTGRLTTADFTAFLDYLQGLRDAGIIDVLTPTTAIYAAVGTTKPNLLGDYSFEDVAAGTTYPLAPGASSPAWYNVANSASSVGGVGRDKQNAAQVSQANTLRQEIQAQNSTRSLRFDAWARNSSTSGSVTARVTLEGIQANNATPIVSKVITASVAQTYTQMTALFGTDPRVDTWRITLDVSGTGSAYFDDCSVVKV